MPDRSQTFANHRAIPHPVFAIPFLVYAAAVVTAVIHLVSQPDWTHVLLLLVALSLLITHFYARRSAQKVQDRLIRLEMHLRLARLMPGLDPARLTLPQVIALRFASDGELPTLVERVLAGALVEPTAIKRAVTSWQADWLRV